jgi:hypothetical protein
MFSRDMLISSAKMLISRGKMSIFSPKISIFSREMLISSAKMLLPEGAPSAYRRPCGALDSIGYPTWGSRSRRDAFVPTGAGEVRASPCARLHRRPKGSPQASPRISNPRVRLPGSAGVLAGIGIPAVYRRPAGRQRSQGKIWSACPDVAKGGVESRTATTSA